MPVKPTSGGAAPRSAAIASPGVSGDDGAGVGLRGVGPAVDPERQIDVGVVLRDRRRQSFERCQHLRRIRLAGDDAAVDDQLAPIRDDVGCAAARDHRGVHARPADERVLAVGEHLGEPQDQPGHRRDRVHAQVRLGAVRRRASRGRGDPGAAPLGQADPEVARFADDARVLRRACRGPTAPSSRRCPCVPRRRPGGTSACPRGRCRRDGSPRRRRARRRPDPSCRRSRGRSVGRPRPRPPTARGPSSTGRRRARRPGARSTRGRGVRPSRTTRRRSAGLRRSGSSRATRRSP